jgi:hypothetical protein
MPYVPFWCSSNVCTELPYKGKQVLSLLTWVQITRDYSMGLLALGLLLMLISWVGHLPWIFRLGGLLPLAASGLAWIAGRHIQNTFGYVLQLEQDFGGRGPPAAYAHLETEITSALHGAMLLEWLVVVVAIVLLLAGALGLWRGFRVRELVREQEQLRST